MSDEKDRKTADNSDVLCDSILNTLSEIENLVAKEDNKIVFDIDTNASSSKVYRELSNLRRSLEQYAGKSQALSYYGFLGHFSSGKTTTINSLLKAEPRPTSHNPTDTAITLLAHQANSSSLIGMHRNGSLAVGTSLLDNQFLSNTVIVDKPGSGDPTIIKEMVRDFLPICDTLIYVFSATAPLDNSDVPTLKKAMDELPFIPIKFVVTRADKFKVNDNQILSAENFDAEKGSKFRSELARRLSQTIPRLNVSPEEILLIDNKSKFNIDVLESYILKSCDEKNNNSIKLHSHKINYYVKQTNLIREFFEDHVCSKIEALRDFLEQAKTNHDDYSNVETMASNSLTESWRRSRQLLDQKQQIEGEWTSDFKIFLDLPDELQRSKKLYNFIQEIRDGIISCSELTAFKIRKQTQIIMKKEFNQHISQLLKRFDSLNTEESEVFSKEELTDDIKEEICTIDEPFPGSLKNLIRELPEKTAVDMQDLLRMISSSVKNLENKLLSGSATVVICETINKSISQFYSMLEEFFKSVGVYRSAILAMNARKTAQEAGIIDTIDSLEQKKITAHQRSKWLEVIPERIFPNWKAAISDFDNNIIQLQETLNAQKFSIQSLRTNPLKANTEPINTDTLTLDWLRSNPRIQRELENTIAEYNNYSQKFFSNLNSLLVEQVVSERHELEEQKQVVRKNRKRKLIKYLIIPMACVVLGTGGYYLSIKQIPDNWLAPIIINLGSGVLLWLIQRIWGNANIKVEEFEKQYQKTVGELAGKLLDNNRSKFDWDFIEEKEIAIKNEIYNRLWDSFKNEIIDQIEKPYEDYYTELKKISYELNTIVNTYINSVRELTLVVSEHYTRVDSNLAALVEVSNEIRSEAIEPSFVMLQDRDAKLKQIRGLFSELKK